MPIHEYMCGKCAHVFEKFSQGGGGESQRGVECPKCGSTRTAKKFSTFASCCGSGSSAEVSACAPSAGGCGSGGGFS